MIEIVSVAGLATVQDRGRPGRMHEGIPPGGALGPELLARANAAARNSASEAGIELFGKMTFTARHPAFVATDGGDGDWLRSGQARDFASGPARVRYIAVRGGLDVPLVLGGRGTLLVAGFGGYEGRPLRRGDTLAVGHAPEVDEPLPDAPDPDAPIRVDPGPDEDRFESSALDVLLTSVFEVSPRSDRVGVRLRGPSLARADGDSAVSGPMVRGAIQVPLSGEPIVLGPDHPTTGGYPVLATVLARDVGALMTRPIGGPVRFELSATAAGRRASR